MQAHIGKWGASCAIRLPKMAVEMLGLYEGTSARLDIVDGALVVRPLQTGLTLEALAAQMECCGVPESFDDGAAGEELL